MKLKRKTDMVNTMPVFENFLSSKIITAHKLCKILLELIIFLQTVYQVYR